MHAKNAMYCMFHRVAPSWVSYLIFFPAALHSSVISNEAWLSRRLSGQCCVKSSNITRQSLSLTFEDMKTLVFLSKDEVN